MSSASILEKLKASHEVTREVSLGDVKMSMRILVDGDHTAAGWAAVDLLKDYKVELNPANADLFENEKTTQLLMRFLVDPDTKQPVFTSPEQVQLHLTTAERNHIAAKYVDFEREYSPTERLMGEAEFADLLEQVKKKPELPILNDLSSATLRKLIASLASRLTDLLRASGSTS